MAVTAGAARAQTWIGATNGEWNLASNWNPASVPNATDATATFSGSAAVNLTSFTATVGTLQLTTANSVALGSTATTTDIINLAKTSGTPTISVASNGTIFVYADVTGSQGLEKTGAGKLTWRFNGNPHAYSGNIAISGGTLGINQNSSLGNDNNDITIATGARLLAEPGNNSGTVTLPATRTITLTGAQSQLGAGNAAVNLVIQGAVGESAASSGLVKTDAGKVTLEGTLSYTGETRIADGTLVLAGSALLPSGQNLRFNGTSGTLDVGSTSQTVRTIVLDNSSGTKTITGAGGSLNVNGATNLSLTGTTSSAVYDLSGLGTFTFNRSTNDFGASANGTNVTSTLKFSAGTNNVTALSIRLGSGGSNVTGQNTTITLGQTNNWNAGTDVFIGNFQGSGSASFQSGLANPVLTVRGVTGGSTATPIFRVANTSSGNQPTTGVLDLTGGSLDLIATEMSVGYHAANANTASTGTLTMPAGTVVATTLNVAGKSASTGTPTIAGTLNQSGGSVTADNVYLGGNAGSTAATFTANYNLTGGTLSAGTIGGLGSTFGASTVRNLAVNGGTIRNKNGGNLTINGLDATSSGRINLAIGASGGTFEADTGQSITIGANTAVTGAGGLTKTGAGTLIIGTTAAYAGATTVSDGTLRVNGALSATSGLSTAVGTTLGGSGSVAAAIAGTGRVGPGNSAGILTATSANVSTGLDFDFEFTQANVNPTWSTAAASVNDVLRLTDSSAPLSGALGVTNTVNVWLDVASLAAGQTFTGGWFTDRSTDFTSSIQGATFVYYVRGDGLGTASSYAGTSYYTLAEYDPTLSIAAAALQIGSADFSGATVTNGYATQFSVVPEPGALAALGLAAGGWASLLVGRRRRRPAG
ncbi:MAG: beta strand repeat-containing protein [Planctomycetota bacterium]